MIHHLPDATKMISDTPRTDARLIEGIMLDGRVEQLDRVYATFARTLERELNGANQIIRQQQLLDEENLRLQERIKRLVQAGDCLLSHRNSTDYHEKVREWDKAKKDKP